MEIPELSKDVISLLQYLAPGFIVSWICFGMTSHQKPIQFERIIQALIYSLFVAFLVRIEQFLALKISNFFIIGYWNKETEFLFSIATAIFLGFLISWLINSDRLHIFLRRLNISSRSSHPSEWCTAFEKNKNWIVVHFKDERRIYGWPSIWPSDPTKGHLMLSQASWLRERNPTSETNVMEDQSIDSQEIDILVDIADVKWVEFIS